MLPQSRDGHDEALHEQLAERAAILEFDAGWPRAIAESEARRWAAQRQWMQEACAATGWMVPSTLPADSRTTQPPAQVAEE